MKLYVEWLMETGAVVAEEMADGIGDAGFTDHGGPVPPISTK